MSAAAGIPPNYGQPFRKPLPNVVAGSTNSPLPQSQSTTQQDGSRHITDIESQAQKRIAALMHAPMTTLLQNANSSFNSARNYLSFRGRRDEAYLEFLVTNEIINGLVRRSPEYPQMISGRSQNRKLYDSLQQNMNNNQEQIKNIRNIIIQENKRVGILPLTAAVAANSNGSISSGSRPQSRSPGVFSGSVSGESQSPRPSLDSIPLHLNNESTTSPSPKSKPAVRPKPEALHGNTINDLNARFAALRNAPQIKMPDATDFQPQRNALPLEQSAPPQSLRPAGPRSMPANINRSVSPVPPPKIPLDTNLPPSVLRPPSPAYSPARNMQTPANVDPPRASARSVVGTGGRSNSYAASVASSRPPGAKYEHGSYFPNTSGPSSRESRRKGFVGLPSESTITAERLFDFLKLYDILLIDVRSRQDFDEGHIQSNTILCVEPLQLRPGISAADVQNSLIISPDEEDALFGTRDQFNLVVFYDQSTKTADFLKSVRTEVDEKLRILYEALVDYNIDKPLSHPPMLLAGGLDAWVDLLGQAALQTSRMHIGMPRRKPSILPSSLVIGRKRIRQFNPLNAEEEKEWAERARSESFNIPTVTAENGQIQEEEENQLPFYQTKEDFYRRFPDVQIEPESMIVAPPPRETSLPSHPITYPRPLSQPAQPMPIRHPERNDLSNYSQPDMPSRPAPTAPRVSYSGAHDRNMAHPFNATRPRYLPPAYISPQEKPANVLLPRTGLVNFGATCYMNSIIQCMSATVPLSRCFKDGSYKKFVQRDNWKGSRGVLPDLYATLIHNLWLKVNDPDSIRPITFRKFCARLNAEWGTDQHQDANDFYIFVMEYLHEDLNVYWRNPPAHVLSKEEEVLREKAPMFLAASIEWDRWSKRERSIISDLFAGQHASQLRCLTCRRTSTTYEPWYNLSVEIAGRGKVTLEECLASYCQEERLSRGQEWSCPHCQTTRDATKRIILTKAPPYLVVHLKRFHMDSGGVARKDSTIVDFPLAGLDLHPYMLPQPNEDQLRACGRQLDQSMLGPFKYNAYGIIEHFGRGLQSGHYISWINDRARKTWRKFDDTRVTDMNGIRPDGAYLIFYERVNVL